jgi:DNA end-binding protein Ku
VDSSTEAHRLASQPNRSTNSLVVSWGLIQFPLSVYSGLEATTGVKRSEFTAAGNPIGRKSYDKVTGGDVEGDVVKKFELAPGQWIELSDEEIAAATGGTVKGQAEIASFIPLEAVGSTYVVEGVSQVRPSKIGSGRSSKPNVAADKAFALLCSAMRSRGVAALAKVALRGPARWVAITPDGDMLSLAFAESVRPRIPMAEAELSAAELALAEKLIDAVGVDTPVLTDDATPKVLAYLQAKAVSGEVKVAVEAPVAAVVDLAAALAASLEATAPAKKARSRKAVA